MTTAGVMNDDLIHFRFGSVTAAVDCPDADVRHELCELFAQFLTDPPDAAVTPMRLSGGEGGEGLMQTLKEELLTQFIDAHSHLLWLHSGAVASGDRAIVLPGPSRRGKSTLVVELMSRGWLYLSDEFAPVHPSSLKVRPFPQKPAWRIHPGREIIDPEQLRKRPVRVSKQGVCSQDTELAACIFPRYTPRASTRLEHCGPSEAAILLMKSCVNLEFHFGNGYENIRRIAEAVPSFHLIFSDGASAVDAIENFRDSLGLEARKEESLAG